MISCSSSLLLILIFFLKQNAKIYLFFSHIPSAAVSTWAKINKTKTSPASICSAVPEIGNEYECMYLVFLEMPSNILLHNAGIAGGKNDHYPLPNWDLWPWVNTLSLSNVDACVHCWCWGSSSPEEPITSTDPKAIRKAEKRRKKKYTWKHGDD